jgi:hypothetical protein
MAGDWRVPNCGVRVCGIVTCSRIQGWGCYDTMSYHSGEANRCLDTCWRFGACVAIHDTCGVYGRTEMTHRLCLLYTSLLGHGGEATMVKGG